LNLVQEGAEYSRQVYSVNQLLAFVGGLIKTVPLIFAGLVGVFQYHGQNMDVVFEAFNVLVSQNRPGIATAGATVS
jgi:hypothetical protein